MNHLHRPLAPVSEVAWAALDDEATAYLKHYLSARKLVGIHGPTGRDAVALATGRYEDLDSTVADVTTRRPVTLPIVELRTTFTLARSEIEILERGHAADLDPVHDAAHAVAASEDGLVFDGVDDVATGVISASPHDALSISDDYTQYPSTVARAVSILKTSGVAGPYGVALGPECYEGVVETTDRGGKTVFDHLRHILGGPIIWAPSVAGAIVVSQRGDDYHLEIGEDFSLGYDSHDSESVTFFLEESVGFRIDGAEAAVSLRFT